MQGIQAEPISDPHPSCNSHNFDSDAYWKCYIYETMDTAIKMTSTCKMAPDSTGVVDDQLRYVKINILSLLTSLKPELTLSKIILFSFIYHPFYLF